MNGSLNLNPNAFGLAMAAVSALLVLILSIIGIIGYGKEAVSMTQNVVLGYELTALGILLGILVSAVVSYLVGSLMALVYNKLV